MERIETESWQFRAVKILHFINHFFNNQLTLN
jgi:hypothetical protein